MDMVPAGPPGSEAGTTLLAVLEVHDYLQPLVVTLPTSQDSPILGPILSF